MTRFSSIFSQLLQLFPRLEFEQAVKEHHAERSAKGFSSWGQFVAMLFCQLGRAHSLREICGGLASCEGKLKHLGVPEAPKKSTLAYANEHRPWELYRTVFGQVLEKCQSVVAGTVLVVDRGYNDYDWFAELTDQEVFFVTRMKDNAVYDVVERREVPSKGHVHSDEVIYFPSMAANGKEYFFRRVEVWDEEQQRTIVFLTNNLKFGATTIAAIYKDRWKVELFFKALKQNCKIKTFLGTTANAVHTQIWTALIAMLVLKYLQLKSTFGWSLSNLVAMLRLQLFVYRDLHAWLNAPFQAPPALEGIHDVQLVLNLAR